jgi:hypothetical protein
MRMIESCAGCGLELPAVEGPTHAYLTSSPACWALYGEVLAREYGDPRYFSVHDLTVDAYAVQHPGRRESRTTRLLALHLVTLCLFLERRVDPRRRSAIHRHLTRRGGWEWLDPPRPNGSLTVAYVYAAASAGEHVERVRTWARDVWHAWELHHDTIRTWAS